MATQKSRPDADTPEPQPGHQRGRSRSRRLSALGFAAVIGVAAVVVVLVVRAADEGPGAQLGGQPDGGGAIPTAEPPTAEPFPSLPVGGVEPGRYAFTSGDPAIDASYEITIEVADGYTSVGEGAVLREGTGQTSVSTLAIGDVYADPCRWQESALLDGAAISSADGVAATLAGQEGLRVSAPTATTVDGFAATYLERRVPIRTDVSDCDLGEFHLYSSGGGDRWLDDGGQRQRLWIVDVDGMPFVIDATSQPDTSRKVQAELEQMVESIKILAEEA